LSYPKLQEFSEGKIFPLAIVRRRDLQPLRFPVVFILPQRLGSLRGKTKARGIDVSVRAYRSLYMPGKKIARGLGPVLVPTR